MEKKIMCWNSIKAYKYGIEKMLVGSGILVFMIYSLYAGIVTNQMQDISIMSMAMIMVGAGCVFQKKVEETKHGIMLLVAAGVLLLSTQAYIVVSMLFASAGIVMLYKGSMKNIFKANLH